MVKEQGSTELQRSRETPALLLVTTNYTRDTNQVQFEAKIDATCSPRLESVTTAFRLQRVDAFWEKCIAHHLANDPTLDILDDAASCLGLSECLAVETK
jgi:hypothetical protein